MFLTTDPGSTQTEIRRTGSKNKGPFLKRFRGGPFFLTFYFLGGEMHDRTTLERGRRFPGGGQDWMSLNIYVPSREYPGSYGRGKVTDDGRGGRDE